MSTTEVRSLPMAPEHHGAFGQDAFGRGAERVARFFGTPQYIIGQTILVVAWIAIKVIVGIVASVFWIVLAIVVVLAVIWAVATLRS